MISISLLGFSLHAQHNKVAGVDLCLLRSASADSIADVVMKERKNARMLLKGDDNCVLATINKLVKQPSSKSYRALEVLASSSDGYVGEYFMDRAVELLQIDTGGFIDFLGSDLKCGLATSLVDGLSMKIAVEKISQEELKKQFTSKLATDLQKKTLNDIFEKVDPKKVD